MRYLLLIATEPRRTARPPRTGTGCWPSTARTRAGSRSRACSGREALQDVATATTVSTASGTRVVTDGPFAETKESSAGYFVIDAPDLDVAIDAAARCPGAQVGSDRDPPDRGAALTPRAWRRRLKRSSPGCSARSTGGRSRR